MESIEKIMSFTHDEFCALTTSDWQAIVDGLLLRLAQEIGIELGATGLSLPEKSDIQRGFTCTFRGDVGLLGLQIEGVLGGQSDPERAAFSASVFLFAQGVRIAGKGLDYYELELRGEPQGLCWSRIGWLTDEYGEFEGVKHFGDCVGDPPPEAD